MNTNASQRLTAAQIDALRAKLDRLHMNQSQRALIAAEELMPLYEIGSSESALVVVAAIVESSATYVRVARALIKRKDTNLDAVRSGSMTLNRFNKAGFGCRESQAPTTERIRPLAADGLGTYEIAQLIGISADHVRKLAKKAGIALADEPLKYAKFVVSSRVIEQAITAVAGAATSLRLLQGRGVPPADDAQLRGWMELLDESMPELQALHKSLKRVVNGHQ